ncbi:hypothetical protein TrCOL_g6910 [Triparma columacea]|uniref:U-box domain-containing protein n=1 Tax=Triparma columacea TaxID=722753 RepID=A0A9W7GJ82_9STRA|nr:hypothetical protein TrCOL_g6910 [Triparma columacea]
MKPAFGPLSSRHVFSPNSPSPLPPLSGTFLNLNLTCPISYLTFVEPVILSDGNTYERVWISRWLEKSHRSPMTMEHLPNLAVRENKLVKSLVKEASKASKKSKRSKKNKDKDRTRSGERIRAVLTCPLSGVTFVDPVYSYADGVTYERDAIMDYIKGSGVPIVGLGARGSSTNKQKEAITMKSPVTGRRVTEWRFVVNRAIKSLVDQARNGILKSDQLNDQDIAYSDETEEESSEDEVEIEEEKLELPRGQVPKRKRASSWEGMWDNLMRVVVFTR